MGTSNILVIDDEQIVLDSVARVLSEEDLNVEVTTSSRQGLEWGTSRNYDLVITDIRMPEIGGMRILREIKRSNPRTAVVILTGYATVQSAVQAMKLGVADYLEKPFTPDALLKTVRTTLEHSSSAAPEPQGLEHKTTVLRVLQRAASDSTFVADLLYHGADALDEYELTGAEKLAILTGDIKWIEDHAGKLSADQRKWLEQRLTAEIW
ncbi:MAG: response regulator [Spirochaetales bacterium]|nr:response regulator [Spirochaetales bacterium]